MESPFTNPEKQAASTVSRWVVLSGIALGTTYQITYQTDEPGDYDLEITLLLSQFSRALSIFEPNSEVSRFNRKGSIRFESPYFYPVLRASAEVFSLTQGAFDPTVGALIEAYGFGRSSPESIVLPPAEQLGTRVDFSAIVFDEDGVERTQPGVQLNFNAIAKGYAVDMVGSFLQTRGIGWYLIELGGEVQARGLNPQGHPWRIGIAHPQAHDHWATVLSLSNQSLATSGLAHNRYEKNGSVYTHLITPQTGRMTASDLWSATVVAEECLLADALATAFMVMGAEKTRQFLMEYPQWQGHLVLHPDPPGGVPVSYDLIGTLV